MIGASRVGPFGPLTGGGMQPMKPLDDSLQPGIFLNILFAWLDW